jgi:hypothetical protein
MHATHHDANANGTVSNAQRLLWAGFMAILAAGVGFSIRAGILTLPAETILLPGHGPLTTVAHELAHNPFFP